MKRNCKKCGREFIPISYYIRSNQVYCDRCARKIAPPSQDELAKRAGREFVDQVQIDADKADAAGMHYGDYMARKK